MFFHLWASAPAERAPFQAVLGDLNFELVNAYRVIASRVEDLIAVLEREPNTEARFLELRATPPGSLEAVARAARFVYLMRTCFNGLWRVNKAGEFNTSWGKYPNPRICDPDGLRAVAHALRGVEIACRPYRDTLRTVGPGDLVYIDPPYLPPEDGGGFVAYTADGFTLAHHLELLAEAKRLDRLGAKVVISNVDTPLSRELYAGWTLHTVSAPRAVAANASKRQAVPELVVTNQRPGAPW